MSTPDGHGSAQTYQQIVCFACPSCYLLFNLRDECLQHMAAKNHFTESLPLSGKSSPSRRQAVYDGCSKILMSSSLFLKSPEGGLCPFLSRSM